MSLFVAPQIRKRINPWVNWIEQGPLRDKVVAAFTLLDRGHKGSVTIEDLEARAHTPAFAKHHAKLKHFYEEALRRQVGSADHREWLHQELPKMTAEGLADVIAFLPEQSVHTPKPRLLKLVPDVLMASVTKELNARLSAIHAPTMADDVLGRLLAVMGPQGVNKKTR